MEKMTNVKQARRAVARGGPALGLARSRRPRVEWIAVRGHDLTFAPFAHPTQDQALHLRGVGVSMKS